MSASTPPWCCRSCGTSQDAGSIVRYFTHNRRAAVECSRTHCGLPKFEGDQAKLAARVCDRCYQLAARVAAIVLIADKEDAPDRPEDRLLVDGKDRADHHLRVPERFAPTAEIHHAMDTFNKFLLRHSKERRATVALTALRKVKQQRGLRTLLDGRFGRYYSR